MFFCVTVTLSLWQPMFFLVNDWAKIVPLMVVSAAVGFYVSRKFPSRQNTWVNKVHQKDVPKIVHSMDMEDIADKKTFCRCWCSKSVKFTSETRFTYIYSTIAFCL